MREARTPMSASLRVATFAAFASAAVALVLALNGICQDFLRFADSGGAHPSGSWQAWSTAILPPVFGVQLSLFFWVVPPFIAGVGLARGYRWPKYMLAGYAVLSIAVRGQTEPIGYIGTIAGIVAAGAAWLPASRHFRTEPREHSTIPATTLTGHAPYRQRSFGIALGLLISIGLAGGHNFYLRRAWVGLIYLAVLIFSLLSLAVGTGWVLLSFLAVAVVVDACRLRILVDQANFR